MRMSFNLFVYFGSTVLSLEFPSTKIISDDFPKFSGIRSKACLMFPSSFLAGIMIEDEYRLLSKRTEELVNPSRQ